MLVVCRFDLRVFSRMSNGVLFACGSVCFSLVSSADRVRRLPRSLLVDFGCHPGGVAVVVLEGRGHLHANLAGERSKPPQKKSEKKGRDVWGMRGHGFRA